MKIFSDLLKSAFYLFAVLGILFIPCPLLPYQNKIIAFIFGKGINFIKPLLFSEFKYEKISSDSSSLYTLIFILLIITLVLSGIGLLKKTWNLIYKIVQLAPIFIPYYLAITLFNYGFEKIVMQQFYAPQSNILHTPFGYLDKDILFWSTIGSSMAYNLFLGISQIITALFLFFKKTRLFGYVSSVVLFVNIVAINFCFDISVKILSIFLLFISLLGLSFYKSVFVTLFQSIKHKKTSEKTFFYAFGKTFFILFFIFKIIYPYYDKLEQKPLLSGGYNVNAILKNNKKVTDCKIVKRIFFYEKGFIIFQDWNDNMTDYKMDFIPNENQFIMTDYKDEENYNDEKIVSYEKIKGNLTLTYQQGDTVYKFETIKIEENSLPVKQNNFHWTIDEIN